MSKVSTLIQTDNPDIMYVADMDYREKYAHLEEELDLQRLKNALWRTLFEVRDEHDVFYSVDLSRLNVAFTHAYGNEGRGAGFCHYNTRLDRAWLGVSMKVVSELSGEETEVVSDMAGDLKPLLAHELCHYKLFREEHIHGEDDPRFQSLLEQVGAATHYNYEKQSFAYNYS